MAYSDRQTPEDFTSDPKVAAAIRERLVGGMLSCSAAFTIVHALDVEPLEVGWTANSIEVRLTRCQLGLFGYPGKQGWDTYNVPSLPVPPGLPEAIEGARDDEGNLPCSTAWELASRFEASRMLVGYVANTLDVKITPCQLGAF
jgi:hypothetical protein